MSTFADLIREALPDDSRREIARKTGVAPETINRIMRDEGDPDAATVDKIAHALKLDVQKAREAVDKPRGESSPYEPPAEANLLDERQRRAVDEIIRVIVASQGVGNAVETTQEQDAPGEASPNKKTHGGVSPSNKEARQRVLREIRRRAVANTEATDEPVAARDTGGISEGERTRRDMDQQGEAPDAEGPEDGA